MNFCLLLCSDDSNDKNDSEFTETLLGQTSESPVKNLVCTSRNHTFYQESEAPPTEPPVCQELDLSSETILVGNNTSTAQGTTEIYIDMWVISFILIKYLISKWSSVLWDDRYIRFSELNFFLKRLCKFCGISKTSITDLLELSHLIIKKSEDIHWLKK